MKKKLAIICAIMMAVFAFVPMNAFALPAGEDFVNPSLKDAGAGSNATPSTSGTTSEKAVVLTNCANVDESTGNGAGIICLLETGADILSVGVGVLAVLGITIVGIQYLTAGGDVGKTQKAKRRMFEIVIGIAIYAAMYAILKFLLPEFSV